MTHLSALEDIMVITKRYTNSQDLLIQAPDVQVWGIYPTKNDRVPKFIIIIIIGFVMVVGYTVNMLLTV